MCLPNSTIDELAGSVLQVIKARMSFGGEMLQSISVRLTSHLREVSSWSDRIDLYGMGEPQYIAESTIALNMMIAPRKFLSRDKKSRNCRRK